MADLGRERTDCVGAGIHSDGQGFAKKHIRQFGIDRLESTIDHGGAGLFHDKFKYDAQQHTERQDPERRQTRRRDHPVIYVHRIKRGCQTDDVDDDGGDGGLQKDYFPTQDRANEPTLGGRRQVLCIARPCTLGIVKPQCDELPSVRLIGGQNARLPLRCVNNPTATGQAPAHNQRGGIGGASNPQQRIVFE